ncbi:MAG: GHKL domain-containing protein [Oscillospiraceae bacterium]|nr:GHKL domain-containing protein [Oscillospiraceae bacterium]
MTLIIISKEYIYSKIDDFLNFIPNGLKILIVISLYIISFFTVDLSYISKTEFTNQYWYYFLEFSFILSLIAFCVIYPIFISSVTSKNYYKKISEIANEQSKKQFHYYQKLLEKDKLLREFKHNYKNQVIVLKAYLAKGNITSAQNYLSDSFDFINEISDIQTGNYILDVLISDKKQNANGIDIEIKGHISAGFIEPIDICTIFGNALDNAIDACQKIKKHNKVIKINIQENANTVHICISNTVDEPVRIINNSISTTKPDKVNHGLGLYSINKSVEKYNGSVNIECNNNVFSINILLVDTKKT